MPLVGLLGKLKDPEQIPDCHLSDHGLRQGQVKTDLILIHPPYPLFAQVASGFKFRDDAADGPLSDPQYGRDFPRCDLAPLGNKEQYRAVIGDETPFWHGSPSRAARS
jgi:hypothetical protein